MKGGIYDPDQKTTEEQVQALWKYPYALLQRKQDAKVYTVPNTRQEFITKMKALLKEYDAELEWTHWYDETEPVIMIKDGYTVSLDDLFEDGE